MGYPIGRVSFQAKVIYHHPSQCKCISKDVAPFHYGKLALLDLLAPLGRTCNI